VLLAGVIIGTAVLPMAVLGHYEVGSTGSAGALVHGLFFFAIGALLQELGFRLILFRLLEELTGTWLGLVWVAAAFAFLHAANPNATVATLLAMGVGDLLLGACFVYTRRIWLVWGFHAGWNYLQDGVLGMPNSGITELASWISPNVSGPEWLTGGAFGIEASWIVLIASVGAAAWILMRSRTEGQIVVPVWRKG
jgi:membrane protease YdiL (CAAX protease family)